VNWLRGTLAPDFTIPTGNNGAPIRPGHATVTPEDYLHRWYILPRNRWLCIYLHRMMHDDDDRGLHDHPGANISLVLRGGYDEHVFAYRPSQSLTWLPYTIIKRRRPGRLIFRRAATAHRLTLPTGVKESWSLFIMFRKWREWGFWIDDGTVRWVRWDLMT
jgi:hypothetical protein